MWVIVVLFSIGIGLLAFRLERHILITGSATIGSYLAMRGLALIFGGYPDGDELNALLDSDDYQKVENQISRDLYISCHGSSGHILRPLSYYLQQG